MVDLRKFRGSWARSQADPLESDKRAYWEILDASSHVENSLTKVSKRSFKVLIWVIKGRIKWVLLVRPQCIFLGYESRLKYPKEVKMSWLSSDFHWIRCNLVWYLYLSHLEVSSISSNIAELVVHKPSSSESMNKVQIWMNEL